MILYRTAKIDGDIHAIDIDRVFRANELNPNYREKHLFTCPYCRKKMMARLGPKNERHFAHIGDACEHNGYLHSSVEEVFYEEYKKCLDNGLPFVISVFSEIRCAEGCLSSIKDCQKRFKKQEINLTDIYKKVSPEKQVEIDGHFRRPDILLESEYGQQLWVEIWATHKSEDDKYKDGDILEVRVSEENEESVLNSIRSHKLIQSSLDDDSVRHHLKQVCQTTVLTAAADDVPISEHLSLDMASLKKIANVPLPPYPKVLSNPGWVDLGLPSGILWSSQYSGTMTFNEAMERFPGQIPTPEQFEELVKACREKFPFPAGFVGPNGTEIEMNGYNFWTNRKVNDTEIVVFHHGVIPVSKNPLCFDNHFAKSDINNHLPVRLVLNCH